MLRKIDRILLRVPNVASAVSYYRDVLGLRVIKQDARVASLCFADDANPEILLHADPDLPAEAIYYLVDDVRDMYRRRKELKLHFVSAPSAVTRGYKATVKDPFGLVLQLLDRTADTAAGAALEDGKPPDALFVGVKPRSTTKRDALVQLYTQIGRTADDLPYTAEFERLYSAYTSHFENKPDREEVWRHLLNLRKAGKLPKLGDARSRPPVVSEEIRAALRAKLNSDLGRRDRLPYTARFESLVDEVNKKVPRPLSPHHIWRLVATVAK